MRLISCRIENFGKLSNVTYDFSGECNTICEDNGWGKSTLASFIRVMFYGFKNENTRPCKYGFFRTEDIETMRPDEVYLGDIYGLWTNNIPFWEEHRDETMAGNGFGIPGDTKCYDLILNQYRACLSSAVTYQKRKAENLVNKYLELGY